MKFGWMDEDLREDWIKVKRHNQDLQSRVSGLEDKCEDIEEDRNKVRGDYEKLMREKNDRKAKSSLRWEKNNNYLEELKETIQDLSFKNKVLEKKLGDKESAEFRALKEKFDETEREYQKLNFKYKKLVEENENLKISNNELKEQIEELQTTVLSLQNENKDLLGKVTTMENRIAKLEHDDFMISMRSVVESICTHAFYYIDEQYSLKKPVRLLCGKKFDDMEKHCNKNNLSIEYKNLEQLLTKLGKAALSYDEFDVSDFQTICDRFKDIAKPITHKESIEEKDDVTCEDLFKLLEKNKDRLTDDFVTDCKLLFDVLLELRKSHKVQKNSVFIPVNK